MPVSGIDLNSCGDQIFREDGVRIRSKEYLILLLYI